METVSTAVAPPRLAPTGVLSQVRIVEGLSCYVLLYKIKIEPEAHNYISFSRSFLRSFLPSPEPEGGKRQNVKSSA